MKSSSKRLNPSHKALIRRYLIWAYKSTKESFDRLERKTTQLMVDEHIWKAINKKAVFKTLPEYAEKVEEFRQYIAKKKDQPVSAGQRQYLFDRLQAVEGAIKYFLGAKELNSIRADYEHEFVRRIWESKDH